MGRPFQPRHPNERYCTVSFFRRDDPFHPRFHAGTYDRRANCVVFTSWSAATCQRETIRRNDLWATSFWNPEKSSVQLPTNAV